MSYRHISALLNGSECSWSIMEKQWVQIITSLYAFCTRLCNIFHSTFLKPLHSMDVQFINPPPIICIFVCYASVRSVRISLIASKELKRYLWHDYHIFVFVFSFVCLFFAVISMKLVCLYVHKRTNSIGLNIKWFRPHLSTSKIMHKCCWNFWVRGDHGVELWHCTADVLCQGNRKVQFHCWKEPA